MLEGLKDPAVARENWAYCRRVSRRYLLGFTLAAIALACLTFYGVGFLKGVAWGRANPAPVATDNKESSK